MARRRSAPPAVPVSLAAPGRLARATRGAPLLRLAMLALALAGAPLLFATSTLIAGTPRDLSAAVWGIISYTRWPQPPVPLRVCVLGSTRHAEAIARTAEWAAPQLEVAFPQITLAHAADACDVVHVGHLADDERLALIHSLVGRPVLSIGEGDDFCSAGGMFCIDTSDGGLRFGANLDALSRSPLRVNPQVLRLGRELNGRRS
ncbi:MAG: YfiR family protein [Rhodocyclaceae bacterium]